MNKYSWSRNSGLDTSGNGTSRLGPDPGSFLKVFALTPGDFSPTTRVNILPSLQHSASESAQNVTHFRYSSELGPLELTEAC